MLSSALFNSAMSIITATALWSARRDGRKRAWSRATLAVGAAAVLLAGSLAQNPFGALRLFAYGLFGFVPFVWLIAAALLRERRWWAGLHFFGFLMLEAVAIGWSFALTVARGFRIRRSSVSKTTNGERAHGVVESGFPPFGVDRAEDGLFQAVSWQSGQKIRRRNEFSRQVGATLGIYL